MVIVNPCDPCAVPGLAQHDSDGSMHKLIHEILHLLHFQHSLAQLTEALAQSNEIEFGWVSLLHHPDQIVLGKSVGILGEPCSELIHLLGNQWLVIQEVQGRKENR